MFPTLSLLIFLLPFCLSSATAGEPYTLLNLLYLVVLLAFSALWVLVRGFPIKNLRLVRYPLFLMLFFLAIAAAQSPAPLKNAAETGKYFIGPLLFMIAAALSAEEKKRLVYEIVLAGLCVSVLALFQYCFGFKLLLNYMNEANIHNPFVLEKIAQQRVFFPFPTPNILGGYLAMVLPLTLTLKRGPLFLVPFAFALFFTKSISAVLSLALVLTALFYFGVLGNPSKGKKILAALFLGGTVLAVFLMRAHTSLAHLLPAFSMEERLGYWRTAWEIIRSHPWRGIGLANFDLPGRSFYAHNLALQFWAEAGIAGVFCFIGLVFLALRNGWKNLKKSPEAGPQAGLFAGSCVFLLHNFADFSFFLPAVGFIWWIMLGLLFSPGIRKET